MYFCFSVASCTAVNYLQEIGSVCTPHTCNVKAMEYADETTTTDIEWFTHEQAAIVVNKVGSVCLMSLDSIAQEAYVLLFAVDM